MIVYPGFRAAVAGADLDALAERAGVAVDSLRAIVAGTHAAPLSVQKVLGVALDADPLELFAFEPHVEAALSTAETRYVTDGDALRRIDEALAPAPAVAA